MFNVPLGCLRRVKLHVLSQCICLSLVIFPGLCIYYIFHVLTSVTRVMELSQKHEWHIQCIAFIMSACYTIRQYHWDGVICQYNFYSILLKCQLKVVFNDCNIISRRMDTIADDFACIVQLPFTTGKPYSFYSYIVNVVTSDSGGLCTHDLVWSALVPICTNVDCMICFLWLWS